MSTIITSFYPSQFMRSVFDTDESYCLLPPLPTEIWRMIIRLATSVPGAFDTSLRSPFDDGYAEDPSLSRQLKDGRASKRPVSLVCKAWRSIAMEYLFEDLTLTDKNYKTVAGFVPSSFPANSNPFRFVVRLRVKFPQGDSKPAFYQPFLRVLQSCTNLSVLHLVAKLNSPSLITSILKVCGPTLRRLDVDDAEVPPDLPQLLSTMSPNLEHLSLSYVLSKRGSSTPLNLPRLHTLRLSRVGLGISSCNLPALKVLRLDSSRDSLPEIKAVLPDTVPMISVCRWQGLHLRDLVSDDTETFAFAVSDCVAWTTCPSIQRISLKVPCAWWRPDREHRWTSQEYENLMAILRNLIDPSLFPALTHIRCQRFNLNLLVTAGHGDWFAAWQEKALAQGIQIDDSVGKSSDIMTDNFSQYEHLFH